MTTVKLRARSIGDGAPAYIIGEIGINHNGSVQTALDLIDVAAAAGCDAVKFQKRSPRDCVPKDQWSRPRETPWGLMTYIEYKERMELDEAGYSQIDARCREKDIHWFASPWDVPSVAFLEKFDPPAHKIASASLTDDELLAAVKETKRPILLSTGMSTSEEIAHAMAMLDGASVTLAHCTSTYPCPPEQINLRGMDTLREKYNVPVGYSGHETGLQISIAAVARGADWLERHITLDRASWGSDHAASLEPGGLTRLVRDVRVVEAALGDGVKRVYDEEKAAMVKLRRVLGQG